MRYPNETIPSQFRLTADTLAQLEVIRSHLNAATPGVEHTKADALRFAIAQTAKKTSRKTKKTS